MSYSAWLFAAFVAVGDLVGALIGFILGWVWATHKSEKESIDAWRMR